MGKYLLQKGLLLDGEDHAAGSVIDLDDKDLIERLTARGTIVEAGEGVEFTPPLTAFEQAQEETVERNRARLKAHGQQMAREAEVRSEEEAKRNADANEEEATSPDPLVQPPVDSDSNESTAQAVTPVEPPQPPQPDPAQPQPVAPNPQGGQPTPQEIEATLQASGLDSDSNDVQIS